MKTFGASPAAASQPKNGASARGPNRVDRASLTDLAPAPQDTVVTKQQSGYTITDRANSYVAQYSFYCFPDTVDPGGVGEVNV